MLIMGNMAFFMGRICFFSDLLIVFRFTGLQAQYLGQNMPIDGEVAVGERLKRFYSDMMYFS